MSHDYTGPYELVGVKDLEDPKYADLTKYRYTINARVVGKTTDGRVDPATGRLKEVNIYDVFFHDRLKNVDLPRCGTDSRTYIGSLRKFSPYLEGTKKSK